MIGDSKAESGLRDCMTYLQKELQKFPPSFSVPSPTDACCLALGVVDSNFLADLV